MGAPLVPEGWPNAGRVDEGGTMADSRWQLQKSDVWIRIQGAHPFPMLHLPVWVAEALHGHMVASPPLRVSASLRDLSRICVAFWLQPRYPLVSFHAEGMVPTLDTDILIRSLRQGGCVELWDIGQVASVDTWEAQAWGLIWSGLYQGGGWYRGQASGSKWPLSLDQRTLPGWALHHVD